MELVLAKEALALLDRGGWGLFLLFTFHNKGDGSIQREIEDIISLVEDTFKDTIRSKRKTSILTFFIVKCFLYHLYPMLGFKS